MSGRSLPSTRPEVRKLVMWLTLCAIVVCATLYLIALRVLREARRIATDLRLTGLRLEVRMSDMQVNLPELPQPLVVYREVDRPVPGEAAPLPDPSDEIKAWIAGWSDGWAREEWLHRAHRLYRGLKNWEGVLAELQKQAGEPLPGADSSTSSIEKE